MGTNYDLSDVRDEPVQRHFFGLGGLIFGPIPSNSPNVKHDTKKTIVRMVDTNYLRVFAK